MIWPLVIIGTVFFAVPMAIIAPEGFFWKAARIIGLAFRGFLLWLVIFVAGVIVITALEWMGSLYH